MFCFSKTCRICKCSTNSYILTCNGQNEVSNLFFNMFPELMNSKMNHYFNQLCVSCVEQLTLFENFKNQCIESDQQYKHYLDQLEGHDGTYAELVSEVGIKQEYCLNDDSEIQEASSYYGSAAHSSITVQSIPINMVTHEISISIIKEENESAIVEDALSIFGCEESGSEEIGDIITLTHQELFASNYHRFIDEDNVAVNENESGCFKETVELCSNDGIKDFHSKLIDSSVNTSTENNYIKLEYCQGKDDLTSVSSITTDDITEIDVVKHEVIADMDGSCNYINSSTNNNESQEFDSNEFFLNHHKGKNTCDLGEKSFSSRLNYNTSFLRNQNLIEHERTHTGDKPYKCDTCKKSFPRKYDLKLHKRSHTREKPYQCDLCGKCFSRNQILIDHRRTHAGEKPYQCDICQKSYSQKGVLIKHKRIHTGEKPHQCDICKKSFSDLSDMRKHKRIHTGEKPYQCNLCQKSFSRNQYLIDHKRSHTGEKPPYQCNLCKMSFSSKSNFYTHTRSHTGEKPYQCNLCQKSFSRNQYLIDHKRSHTGEEPPYQCNLCKMRFTCKSNLDTHERNHTGEKPYQCDICEKSFLQKSYLKIHKRTHSGEKPHQCDICKKSFSQKSYLKIHKRTHTREKPYQCDLCEKRFASNSNLYAHKKAYEEKRCDGKL